MSEWWEEPPAARTMVEPRRTAEREHLAKLVAGPERARRTKPMVVAVAGLALVSATGAGVLVLNRGPAAETGEVHCHTTLEPGRGINFAGAAFELREGYARRREAIQEAFQLCADLWEQGILRPGAETAERPLEDPQPVPPLLGCLAEGGQAAVYPTDDLTCAALGLGELQL